MAMAPGGTGCGPTGTRPTRNRPAGPTPAHRNAGRAAAAQSQKQHVRTKRRRGYIEVGGAAVTSGEEVVERVQLCYSDSEGVDREFM